MVVLSFPEEKQRKIIAQYEAVRRLGQTNMFDASMVQRIAFKNGFYDLVRVIDEGGYASILDNYSQLISMITAEDIPEIQAVQARWELERAVEQLLEQDPEDIDFGEPSSDRTSKLGPQPVFEIDAMAPDEVAALQVAAPSVQRTYPRNDTLTVQNSVRDVLGVIVEVPYIHNDAFTWRTHSLGIVRGKHAVLADYDSDIYLLVGPAEASEEELYAALNSRDPALKWYKSPPFPM